MEWLDNLTYWQWWILGIVLIILEIFSPAAFFLWMGIAAGIVGLILLLVPGLAWMYQLLIFSLFSMATIALWRLVLQRNPTKSDQPRLNRRGEQYIDRLFTLEEPIINGFGKIRVDDSIWRITGVDCAAGSQVRIVGVDGSILKVEIPI